MHFAIDWQKGQSRQFLTTEERRLFAQAVAWGMFQRQSIEVSYEDIVHVVRENENILARLKDKITIHNLEEVVSDVQICTFLTRFGNQGFRFVHRSFMEFFVARYIKCIVEEDRPDGCLDRPLPYEILYFLGGFALFEGRFIARLEYRLRNQAHRRSEGFKRNLIGIQLYSGHQFSRRKFAGVDITEMQFKDIDFVDVEFEGVSFLDCHFRRLTWEGISVDAVTFRSGSVQEWNCAFIRGSMCLSEMAVARWQCEGKGPYDDVNGLARPGAPLRIVAKGLEIQEAFFDGIEIALSGALRVAKGTINGSTVTLDAGSAQRQDLGASSFKRTSVTCKGFQRPGQIDVSRASFEACELRNVPVSYDALTGMRDNRRLDRCRGVLLVFGVPAHDKTFVLREEENGQEISVRHWWVMEKGLLLVDWNLLRQRAESVEPLDEMLNQLGKGERAILEGAIVGEAAA